MSPVVAEKPIATTYPVKCVEFARRCYAGGHSIYAIVGLVERHHGVRPSWTTVRRWVDDDYAEAERRRTRKGGRIGRGATPIWKRRLAQCHLWHSLGIGGGSVAKLANHEWDLNLSADQMRQLLAGRTQPPAASKLLTGEVSDARGIKK